MLGHDDITNFRKVAVPYIFYMTFRANNAVGIKIAVIRHSVRILDNRLGMALAHPLPTDARLDHFEQVAHPSEKRFKHCIGHFRIPKQIPFLQRHARKHRAAFKSDRNSGLRCNLPPCRLLPQASNGFFADRGPANHAPHRLRIPQHLHFDCDTVFPPPTLTTTDDSAVHSARNFWRHRAN